MDDLIIIPSGSAKRVLAQYSAGRLKLERFEALNDNANRYFDAKDFFAVIGLSEHIVVADLLSTAESRGVALAMQRVDPLDRVVAYLPPDPLLVSQCVDRETCPDADAGAVSDRNYEDRNE